MISPKRKSDTYLMFQGKRQWSIMGTKTYVKSYQSEHHYIKEWRDTKYMLDKHFEEMKRLQQSNRGSSNTYSSYWKQIKRLIEKKKNRKKKEDILY